MESIVALFAETLGKYVSPQVAIFIISLFPILECRAGLIAAALLQVKITRAIPICVIGNVIPIPFILLFVKRLFQFLKRFNWSRKWIEKLENRAMNKSNALKQGEFLGLMLFVGIPLPGTGAWTGSLIAALLEMDIKKASIAILLGVLLATTIISILSYGLLSAI